MDDGTGLAEKMLGLSGFRVLSVEEVPGEVVVTIETLRRRRYCPSCRKRAEAQDRVRVPLRDLSCFGRATRLVWVKRRWRCKRDGCVKKTWTERHPELVDRQVLTPRAGMEATRQVGLYARSVASVAKELGVSWDTVMAAVVHHGTPLIEARGRTGVRALGVDETSFRAANAEHSTTYATSLVDLDRRVLIDLIEGRNAADLRRWLAERSKRANKATKVVALDLTETYRSGLSPHLSHAIRVADPFHVIRVANRCLDQVRRRVQNETLAHRGRKDDPLYKIRKLLLKGAERLDEKGTERLLLGLRVGDPSDEVLGAWMAKESVRDVYLTDDLAEATILLDKAIAGCLADEVEEIRTLGRTLSRWRQEILNHHRTGASNGPTEGNNFCVKQVKRAARGMTTFEHYRLRVLLHAGGVTWPSTPFPPPLRRSVNPH